MTTITIGAVVLAGWHGSSSVQLRLYADRTFQTPTGTIVESGSFNTGFYKAFTCSLATTNLTIASGTLEATRDSSVPNARYSGYFFDTTTNALIQAFDGFVDFSLPATPTTTTWSDILTFGQAAIPIPIDHSTFDRDTILSLIAGSASMMTGVLSIPQGGTGQITASAALSALGGAARGANTDITSLGGLTTPLSIAQGGTNAITAAAARSSLGVAASGANSDITSLTALSTPLSVLQGGLGLAAITANSLILGNGTAAPTLLALGAANTVLTGTGAAPAYSSTPTLASVTLSAATPITFSSLTAKSVLFLDASKRSSQDAASFYYESASTPPELNVKGRYRLRATTQGTMSFRPPASMTANQDYDYTWPADYGTNAYVLTTDGSGVLTWMPNSGMAGTGITGITAPSGGSQTGPGIIFATGTGGTDFAISGSANTITFSIPDTSALNRGLITTGAQTIAGAKTHTGQIISSLATGTAPLAVTSTTAVTNLTLSADTQLPTISTALKVSNSATTAASANTNSAIVARDGSGNFAAGTITATLSGNATNVSGTVTAANGGTGQSSYTIGNILYATGTAALSALAPNATAARQFLLMTSSVPAWAALTANDIPNLQNLNGTLDVTSGGSGADMSATSGFVRQATAGANFTASAIVANDLPNLESLNGTLDVNSGGTGVATLTTYALLAGGTTATGALQQITSLGTSGMVLTSNGAGALPTFQAPSGGGGGAVSTVTAASNTDLIITPTSGNVIVDIATYSGNYSYYLFQPYIGATPTASSVGSQAAATLAYASFYLPARLSFTKISMGGGSGTSGTYNIGIYNAAGTRLVDSGAFTLMSSQVNTSSSLTGSSTSAGTAILAPGYYLMAWATSVSSQAVLGVGYSATGHISLISQAGAVGTVSAAAPGGVLPSAFTPNTTASAAVSFAIPLIRLHN